MANPNITRHTDDSSSDLRWKDLYKIGAISLIIIVMLMIFAIIAFFIWPYKPGYASTVDVFTTLQNNMIGGLMSLDTPMVIIELITILPLLALYVSLKPINESYALIALVIGLMSIVFIIPTRPLSELVLLSDKYSAATTEAVRSQCIAAGEAFLTVFKGTTWMVFTFFTGVSCLISSLLMLKSNVFSKATAYVGIITSTPGFVFFIPVIGIPILFIGTLSGIIWYILLARTFIRLGWPETTVT
jgi:hypothetical protein